MSQDDNPRADILTEFFEVALHTILFIRGIYPKQIFTMKKKYQIPIHIAKHPKVNEYLNGCLKTIRSLLQSDSVKSVSLVVLNGDESVEKHVFSVKLTRDGTVEDYFVSVEEIFRQFVLKLTVMDSYLKPLPEDCTFAVQVTTNEQCYVRLNESPEQGDFPWVEAEKARSDHEHRIVSVKSVECSLFALNAYVEV